MLGSSILDIAIGLVFVYLLLSLMVTATSEMVAALFSRRPKNLWRGLVNLLGKDCAQKLYEHSMIKGISPPSGKPSYIDPRTFAVSLLDVVGFNSDTGVANEVRRALDNFPETVPDARALKLALLAANNSSLAGGPDAVREFQGFLLTIPDTAAYATAAQQLQAFLNSNPAKFSALRPVVAALLGNPSNTTLSAGDVKAALLRVMGSPPICSELTALLQYIPDSASPSLVKQEVLRLLDKLPLPQRSSMLMRSSPETGLEKSLLLLWNEAGQDIEKFKENVEGWFNDAMDRVSGWYKRGTQLVNFISAVIFTLALNVDTILLVNTLAKNSALRDSLVAQASKFAEQPPVQVQVTGTSTQELTTPSRPPVASATNEPFYLSLSPETVVSGENLTGTLTLNETNSGDLNFKLSFTATNLASVPGIVTVPRGQKSAEFPITTRPLPNSARVNIGASNRVAVLTLLPNPQEKLRVAKAQLDDLTPPIGWVLETNKSIAPSGAPSTTTNAPALSAAEVPDRNHQLFLIFPNELSLFWKTLEFHALGWVLTAIAVSLGAPFWFDVLNKFISIRSSGKAPEEKPKPPK